VHVTLTTKLRPENAAVITLASDARHNTSAGADASIAAGGRCVALSSEAGTIRGAINGSIHARALRGGEGSRGRDCH
jgi:hypothetical protein